MAQVASAPSQHRFPRRLLLGAVVGFAAGVLLAAALLAVDGFGLGSLIAAERPPLAVAALFTCGLGMLLAPAGFATALALTAFEET